VKEIDLSLSLYDLTEAYPELIEVLKELGFAGVAQPALRSTMGKLTTLPEGCDKHGIDLGEVVGKLKALGFEVKP